MTVHAVEPVTIETLLKEMTDRDALARLPSPSYLQEEVSSHNPVANDPSNPKTWHVNNDSQHFLRTEVNAGRTEWVIMDVQGPGAITRMWTPLWGKAENQIVRFYFDGSATPQIEVNFLDLISGRAFVKPPLAFVSTAQTNLKDQLKPDFRPGRNNVGADLYLPIPFAGSCKVTLSELPFYDIVNYRLYPPATQVQTFSMDTYQAAQALVDQTGETLTAPPAFLENAVAKQAVLEPGADLVLDLPAGANAVKGIQVQIDPNDPSPVLRTTVIEGTFDGEQTIWCPLSEFFGAGVRLEPVHDWCRTVTANGILTASWVMPYQKTGMISLKNLGDKAMTVKVEATTAPWSWDQGSLYFHAKWHAQSKMATRPFSDWNYVGIKGSGVYVGDTLTVYSPVKEWYGEGNEAIYVDGEEFPSQTGTGTEDYYGYAWGMADFFNSPFLSEPRRDGAGLGNREWRGYTTTSRIRVLDATPFTRSLKFNMEIWDWNTHAQLDYAVGSFWYGLPGGTDNREPQPEQAAAALKATHPFQEDDKGY